MEISLIKYHSMEMDWLLINISLRAHMGVNDMKTWAQAYSE